jgi:SAM-dependent methyltransferase
MSLVSFLIAFASQAFPRLSSRVLASSGYTLDIDSFGGPEVFSVWTVETAERQDRAWHPIVEAAKAGHPREDVAALGEALESLGGGERTLLEVGCGGGYNSEIINSQRPELEYQGIDISDAMIAISQAHYPDRPFLVGSAYELPFEQRSFDVVIDGVALIHMPDWRRALAEYARVASNEVILHGLTLTDTAPTTKFAKYAYGQPAVELVFNRAELLALCTELGMTVSSKFGGLDYDLERYLGIESVSETWVLKVNA